MVVLLREYRNMKKKCMIKMMYFYYFYKILLPRCC
jgi:hypothetical protein